MMNVSTTKKEEKYLPIFPKSFRIIVDSKFIEWLRETNEMGEKAPMEYRGIEEKSTKTWYIKCQ